ncbi:MAG: hypothetical protein IKP00_13395 [Victivallales bacterium]|nr:hypothetical protein [Victivallales bacterium]
MNTNKPDIHPENNLGLNEREMLMITGAQERLDYPTEPLTMANGCTVERYVIPDEDRQEVLEALYPFCNAPSLDDELMDIHTNTPFKVRDYLAIREGNLNFLAAPRYAEAGGTVLDWVALPKDDDASDKPFPLTAKTIKGGLYTGVNASQKADVLLV